MLDISRLYTKKNTSLCLYGSACSSASGKGDSFDDGVHQARRRKDAKFKATSIGTY